MEMEEEVRFKGIQGRRGGGGSPFEHWDLDDVFGESETVINGKN